MIIIILIGITPSLNYKDLFSLDVAYDNLHVL